MTSLPIPESLRSKSVSTSFNDLGKQTGQLISIPEILNQLRPKFDTSQKVHLDPDIRPSLRPRNTKDQIGYFGQDGSAMTELKNNDACEPYNQTLFLFYGWFKGVCKGNNGGLQYEKARINEPRTHHQHVIWGWLQSDGRPRQIPETGLNQDLRQFDYHPHIEERYSKNNYIFVSRKKLSFANEIPGSGVFTHYKPTLRLTCPEETDKRSSWILASFLHACARGRIAKPQWRSKGINMRIQYKGYGQEFIFDTSDREDETSKWLDDIFQCVTEDK
jgi:hypothetical protein